MNFVRHDRHAVAQADVAHTSQLLRCPYPPDRIVGIAQQQEFRFRVGRFRFEIVEVDRVATIPVNEIIGRQLASVVAYRRIETVVCRRLDDDLVARFGQRLDDGGQGGHYATRVDHPPGIDPPAMTALEPPDDRIVIGFGHFGVTENTVLHPFTQGFHNSRCRTEVHIRHPHGQRTLFFGCIPLVRVRPAPRDDCIEIVLHKSYLFIRNV